MIPIAHYLFAIAFSGLYNKSEWQKWADERILREQKPKLWLINVSLSRNIDDLSKALSDLMIIEKSSMENEPPFSDAVIGYYYLKYMSKDISINELLQMSGEEADGGEGATKACEEFYEILNKLEGNKDLEFNPNFMKMIEESFEPFKNIAMKQKEVLENF
ncbi:hypothetical protein [Chengkuizengella axinellae]|uniref:Uncharacterized protein n=1 Tax=Chengkuizengella axinellae TaxID=3064388 RepID=A0ABT9J0H2_9BACL|nr:hypothetical protein [Chengkuizengella sp. 2205SS18-9]MDP5275121.1 hypothetical protein [Chengkuizengella sp. 2205SS18-9]